MAIILRKGDNENIYGTIWMRPPEVPDPVDITGWVIWFTIKRRWPDGDGAALLQKTIGDGIEVIDAEAGTFVIRIDYDDLDDIPNAERTVFICDVQVKDHLLRIKTIAQEPCIVLGDVTLATS